MGDTPDFDFSGYSHRELAAMVSTGAGPKNMQASDQLRTLYNELNECLAQIRWGADTESSGWSGEAASAAKALSKRIETVNTTLRRHIDVFDTATGAQTAAAMSARNNMPEPQPDPTINQAMTGAGLVQMTESMHVQEAAYDEATQRARDVMNQYATETVRLVTSMSTVDNLESLPAKDGTVDKAGPPPPAHHSDGTPPVAAVHGTTTRDAYTGAKSSSPRTTATPTVTALSDAGQDVADPGTVRAAGPNPAAPASGSPSGTPSVPTGSTTTTSPSTLPPVADRPGPTAPSPHGPAPSGGDNAGGPAPSGDRPVPIGPGPRPTAPNSPGSAKSPGGSAAVPGPGDEQPGGRGANRTPAGAPREDVNPLRGNGSGRVGEGSPRALPGAPDTEATGRSGASATTERGRAGAGSPLAPGARSRGEEDKEHRRRYGLDSDEYFGVDADANGVLRDPSDNDMHVAPPVIGE